MRFLFAFLFAIISCVAPNCTQARSFGTGPNPNLTEVDALPQMQGVCGAKLYVSGYRGPLYQIVRDSDQTTEDVYSSFTGWPDKNALSTWLAGSVAYVSKCYDQSGNGDTLTAASVAYMPYLNLDGSQPVFEFDGAQNCLVGGATPFTNGSFGASAVMVRQYENNSSVLQYGMALYGGTTNGNIRMAFELRGNASEASGSNTDSVAGAYNSTGFPNDTNWHVEIGTWNFNSATMTHYLDGQSEVLPSYQPPGITSQTNSLGFALGCGLASTRTTAAGGYAEMKFTLLAFSSQVINATQIAELQARLQSGFIPGTNTNQFMTWSPSWSLTGPYTMAPGVTNTLVTQPDGTTPSLSDTSSLRYHHHTRVAVDPSNGRVWVCYSANPVNENDTGMFSECSTSTDNGVTWTNPIIAVPNQSTFFPAGGYETTGLAVYPRVFYVYNGVLYYIVDVDGTTTGLALLAIPCNQDGTMGTPFVISPGGMWTPYSNAYPTYNYDPVLGPILYAYARNHENWAGTPAQFTTVPLSDWTGETRYNGMFFCEDATITLPNGEALRIWRKLSYGLTHNLWIQISHDGMQTWGPIVKTNLPNEPSSVSAIVLSNGHLAIIDNPVDRQGYGRDPLYVALFDSTTGSPLNLYAIRQCTDTTCAAATDAPTWFGSAKSGGPAYPGVWESAFSGVDTLYVSYSWHGKENIGLAEIPVSGL